MEDKIDIDDLFDKHATPANSTILKCLDRSEFRKALRDYKQSILTLADEMIEKEDISIKQYKESKSNQARIFHQGRLNLLTELKQKIEAL